MARYIAFRTKYLQKLISEDGKTCKLSDVIGHNIVLIRCWWNGKDYFFHQYENIYDLSKSERDVINDALLDIPYGSIVFERTDGKNITLKDLKLFNYLVDAKYCCIYNLKEIIEYPKVLVVECESKSI